MQVVAVLAEHATQPRTRTPVRRGSADMLRAQVDDGRGYGRTAW